MPEGQENSQAALAEITQPEPFTHTGILRANVHINPHYESIAGQGIDFAIPGSLINQNQLPGLTDETRDELTRLPIETDAARTYVVSQISAALREGKGVAIETVDGDNIKVLNLTDRNLGDLGIVYSAARTAQGALVVGQAFSETAVNGSKKPQVIVLRQKDAADETVVIYLDVTEEDVARLKEQRKIDDEEFKVSNPNAVFSQTSSIISTTDTGMIGPTLREQHWLKENPDKISYKFYNAIRAGLDQQIKIEKGEKQWKRLDDPKFFSATSLSEHEEVYTKEFGGGRVSPDVLTYLQQHASVKTVQIQAERMIKLGRDPKMLLSAYNLVQDDLANISSTEAVQRIFQRIHNPKLEPLDATA